MLVPKVAAPVLPNTNFAGRPAVPEAPFEINDIEESFIAVPSTCKAAVTPPTVLEAGWQGVLTLELSNHTSNQIRVYANSGAAQILFFQGEDPAVSYADKKGKYMNQGPGITLAKSK